MSDYLLQPGDIIVLDKRHCRVLRVNDCAAVVAVPQTPRTFTTLMGETVTIQPKPKLVRISPNSETPILNR